MARRATLKDVAAAAGVSVTTVSLVLNDRPARVSTEKREAIAQAVKQLNYVPNQNARSLVTKQSKLVALIVPDIENLFFAALAKCVEDECAAQGYSLIVANSDDSRDVGTGFAAQADVTWGGWRAADSRARILRGRCRRRVA